MGEGEQPLRKKLRMILREISGPRRAIAVDGGRMSERRVVGVGVLVLVALVVLLRGRSCCWGMGSWWGGCGQCWATRVQECERSAAG